MQDRIRRFVRGRGLVFVPWLVLAATDSFGAALDGRQAAFRDAVSVGLWVAWALVLVLLVVPGAGALVASRVAATASVPAVLWAVAAADDGWRADHVVSVSAAAIAALAAMSPVVGEQFVDATSYGDENRRLLRPPAPVLIGPLVPTWAATVVGVVAGPLMLAAGRWGPGAVLTIVGLPTAFLGFRALLRLAQRWLVFVPAGVVVHDHVAITEPVLIPRRSLVSFGPAPADSTALDLTARAPGLALELRLRTPLRIGLRADPKTARDEIVDSVLVTPTRPAAVLTEAAARRFPIG